MVVKSLIQVVEIMAVVSIVKATAFLGLKNSR